MAWRLTIGGVDYTAAVDSFSTTVALNDRARASVVVADLQPPRYAELVSTAADGLTPLFGGVILQRSFQGRTPYDPTYQLTLEVGDWFTYTDWCYTTRAYPVAVTLKQVLADLVAEHLAPYGITLDPAQVDGPTIAPFTWMIKRVADALRELSDRTTYVVRIDPAKRLRMFVPATLTAPVALTEAAPHCQEVTWRDSDRTPYNRIILTCGPAGPAELDDERHHGDGTTRIWPLNAPFIQMIGALSVFSEGGGGYPVGIYGVDDLPWTVDLADNTMHQRADQPVIAAGDYWWIKYQAQFPFTVSRSTGATPVVEYVEARPDVLSIPVAEEIATNLLAQAQEAPREAVITTDQDGFIPGQALTIDLPTTRSITGTFLITSVALVIVQDTAQGDRLWQYTLEAIDSPLYQGSYLDDWREIAGVGGGSTTITGGTPPGGGGGGGDGEMLPLPAGQIYVGTSGGVAAAVPMSGDIGITPAGVTQIAAGTIVNADVAAGAGIVDTKLATIATPGKVANSATTASVFDLVDTIMLRNSIGDTVARNIAIESLSGAADIVVFPDQNLRLRPESSLVLEPVTGSLVIGPGARFTLPDLGYKQNLGTLQNKFLTLHAAELWVETLVAQDTIATIGGRVVVSPTTMLARDLGPSDTVMYVKHNAFKLHVSGVEIGSKLFMQSAGKFEAFAVGDMVVPPQEADGSYGYAVQRNLDGSGPNEWFAGDAVLDTGKTGDGFIDLYSVRGLITNGIGPTIAGNVRMSTLYNDIQTRWAIGNLNQLYGYTGDVYGAAFGVPTGAWIKIDPVNGVRLGHNATTVSQIDAAGNAFFAGSVTAAAGEIGGWSLLPDYIYAPFTNTSFALNSAVPALEIGDPRPQGYAQSLAGIWMGKDTDGAYKFRACSANGLAGFFWDGAIATFRGDGAGVTNIHGGNIQTGTVTANQIAANTITGGQIAGDTITAAHLAAGSVTASELAAGAVTAASIQARSITADRLVVGTLTSTEIAANTITADRLNVGALSAISANLGTVTAGSISGNAITGGTINGTTITGVSISGSSITAGSGNTIVLDYNGLQIAEGNGTGSARIILGGQSLFCSQAKITVDGNFHGQRDANFDQDLYVARNANVTGYVSAAGVIACGTMNTVPSGLREVFFNFANNQFCFWTNALGARADVLPWAPPDDPLAVLQVPIVTYAGPLGRELGVVVEALAEVAPYAVSRDTEGLPDGVREGVLGVYLLTAVKALEARLRALEGTT